MDLRQDRPGEHLYIRSISEQGIQVVDQWHTGPLVLSAQELVTDWPVREFAEITEHSLQPVFAMNPDVVLLGTGATQKFLPPELMVALYERGIGAETMTTDAACRTFNVLVSEERRVVAALLPVNSE